MKKLIFFSVVALFMSCGSSGTKQSDQTGSIDQSVKVSNSSSMKDIEVESIRPKELIDLQSILGLFTGNFEVNPITAQLRSKLRGITDTMDDEVVMFEYGRVAREFYENLTEDMKPYMYLDPLYGDYGFRHPNAISLIFTRIEGDSVFGTSICAGNEREIKGVVTPKNDSIYELVLREPGDNRYDGLFTVDVFLNGDSLGGQFTPYIKGPPVKQLVLHSSEFNYSPRGEEWSFDREYFGKNISTDSLNENDVEVRSKHSLRILRNIIYARHGYSFKTKDVREFFERYDWYVPFSTDVRNELTAIERYNISLIKRYEAYAEDYYDDYGR